MGTMLPQQYRTTFDDLYCKRTQMATVHHPFSASARDAFQANENVRMLKTKQMQGSHSWSSTYDYANPFTRK